MLYRVDLSAQFRAHREEILAAVERVLEGGRYTLGPEVAAFEREFAEYLGVPEAVGVADGTRAIALVLEAIGVGAGHEVITTPFTAIPTIGAIMEVGATPVLVDVDADTYLMDLEATLAAVTPRTRAVVPVHIFGNVLDVRRLREMLGPYIPVIEDAAQAHGSRRDGLAAGTMAEFGTFSFYPTKNLGGYGDGGAIVTTRPEVASRLRVRRNHGMVDKDTCAEHGVNCRLDELQAAILRVKLRHLDAMNAARGDRVAQYLSGLPEDWFCHQRLDAAVTSNWHIFESRFLGDRDGLARFLEERGIQTNVYYALPHHLQPALRHLGYGRGAFPNVELICRQAIAFPLYPEIACGEIDRVVAAVCEFCAAGA
ncbi:MAG: DegT/DnrJ/EryC1/StrS family aminotransferase [Gammaproteobacteria bacterium]|jgi:dTDP-4-amino-4,6-dideoxygalactose transaminase|nr:DegT/DnrJ/EryC1/StrS family aminotransferase [Gammaproteobacteria bacterium]